MADTSGLPPLEPTKSDTKSTTGEIPTLSPESGMGPSSKEVMIGAGSLLVLALIFFFIRNAYANYLVSSLKRSPNNAGLAGWGLFGGLLFGAAIGSIALISTSFMTVAYIAPLSILSLICFVLCFVVTSKK
jgi:hypothetical protein